MTWLSLIYTAIAVGQLGVVFWVRRQVDVIRRCRQDWDDLADTQRGHEFRIRYLHELVNPMARSGTAPMPRHLRTEKP